MSATSNDWQLAAVIVADRDGIIREWSVAAERIFGYSAIEAIGRTLDLIVPEEERADHWRNYRRVMATNIINYSPDHILDVEGLRKDGSRVPLDAMLTAAYDGSQRITAVKLSCVKGELICGDPV